MEGIHAAKKGERRVVMKSFCSSSLLWLKEPKQAKHTLKKTAMLTEVGMAEKGE